MSRDPRAALGHGSGLRAPTGAVLLLDLHNVWTQAMNPGGSRDRCETLPALPTLPAPQWVFALRWSPTGEWLAASTSFPDRPQEVRDENPIVLWRLSGESVSDTERVETHHGIVIELDGASPSPIAALVRELARSAS